jgi:cysteine-S-conjugate beta-lyase
MHSMTHSYDFDQITNRRGTHCVKHDLFDEDVLSMWVADMDFPSPQPVVEALQARAAHGVFGYTRENPELRELLCQRMAERFDWQITPGQIVILPGVISAFNVAIRAFGEPGGNVLMQPPVYPPFLTAPGNHGQTVREAELIRIEDGSRLHYEIDFDAFEAAIDAGTKVFLLCSPHNPVGRVWSRDELARMAEICLKRDVIICSDEIHCDLLFDGIRHSPIAALAPEIAARTVTLMAPSKTFNLPALGFAFAIIQNEDLKQRFEGAAAGIVPHVSVMGFTAALAAYRDGGSWLEQVLDYMQANRDFTTGYLADHLPGMRVTHPQGTYLSWLDCRRYQSEQNSKEGSIFGGWIDPFFLKKARVALNSGALFGKGGEGFARLNFACPRPVLVEALERMWGAIS